MSDLEEMLASITAGNFEKFDEQQAERAKNAAKASAVAKRDRERLAGAAARLAETDDGRLLLEWITARTLRRISFLVQAGMTSDQVALIGAKREGANELAFEILRLVAEGRGEALTPRT